MLRSWTEQYGDEKNSKSSKSSTKTTWQKWNEHKWKIYFKKNGNSMLLFDGLNGTNAILRRNTLKRLFSDWKGHFIITK